MGILKRFFGGDPKKQFAQQAIDSLRKAGEQRPIDYDSEDFLLKCGDATLFLGNAFAEYEKADEEGQAGVLHRFVQSWISAQNEMPEEFGDAKHDVLPALRSLAYLEASQMSAMGMPKDSQVVIPREVIADRLGLALVYDLPHSLRTISQDDLDDWGVTFYEAMEIAKQNLAEIEVPAYAQIGEGTYMIETCDSYDASRMILLDRMKLEVKGNRVAMVPVRDCLIVTGDEDTEGLQALLQLGRAKLEDGARPISLEPFVFKDGDWYPLELNSDHPAYEQLVTAQLGWRKFEYDEQAAALNRVYEAQCVDLFVANFTPVQSEASGFSSYCVWSQDVASLLPKTDKIAFYVPQRKEGEMLGLVPWERFTEKFPDSLHERDCYPPRFETREFPDVDLLLSMCES